MNVPKAQFYVYAFYAQNEEIALSTWHADVDSKDREVCVHKDVKGPSIVDPRFNVARGRIVVFDRQWHAIEDWVRGKSGWTLRA